MDRQPSPPTPGSPDDDPRVPPRPEPGDAPERSALRIGAKALVTAPGRVFLVKERRADGSTFWTLPGGGVRTGESLSECLRREVSEEIQCESTVGPAVTSCTYRHTTRPVTTLYPVFLAVLETSPDPNPSEGVVDCAWREPTDLPSTTLDPFRRVVERAVVGPDPNSPTVDERRLRSLSHRVAADRTERPDAPSVADGDGADIR